MNLSNQVCSLEQSKELRRMGVVQDSLFYHFPNPNTESIKKKFKLPDYDIVAGEQRLGRLSFNVREFVLNGAFQKSFSAFTVSELCVMLGDHYPSWSFKNGKEKVWIATVINKNDRPDGKNVTTAPSFDRYGKNQAQALASLLIDVIKVGHVKIKDINKRLLTN